ncbi:MAG: hypothetical protein LBI58_06305, partial [Tannerellaceae bacterium]|nr:hypothetical protein [Tannerellaceae bacterium]
DDTPSVVEKTGCARDNFGGIVGRCGGIVDELGGSVDFNISLGIIIRIFRACKSEEIGIPVSGSWIYNLIIYNL